MLSPTAASLLQGETPLAAKNTTAFWQIDLAHLSLTPSFSFLCALAGDNRPRFRHFFKVLLMPGVLHRRGQPAALLRVLKIGFRLTHFTPPL